MFFAPDSAFADALAAGPRPCDGAMGTLLHAYGLALESCLDEANLSRPALVLRAHSEYLNAGASIVETNTFGANPIKLAEHSLADRVAADQAGTACEEGIRIAQEILLALRPVIQGVYIMPPFRRYDVAAEVMAVLRQPVLG